MGPMPTISECDPWPELPQRRGRKRWAPFTTKIGDVEVTAVHDQYTSTWLPCRWRRRAVCWPARSSGGADDRRNRRRQGLVRRN